jgi:cytochrome c oxidase subunit 2
VPPAPGAKVAAQETPIYVVPEGQPLRLRMASIDVIHSFWVPDFRAKFDVFPNRYTSTWFQPSKIKGTHTLPNDKDWGAWAGTPYEDHWVFCAEYCGASHSDMYAILRVVPPAAYEKIIAAWAVPTGEPAVRGAKYYKIKGCYSCHSVDGSRIVGPTWKNMFGYPVEFSDGRSIPAVDADYVRKSILTPAADIVKGYPNQMTFQKVTQDEIDCLIAYMQSISDKGGAPAPGQSGASGASGATAPSGGPAQAKPVEAPKK